MKKNTELSTAELEGDVELHIKLSGRSDCISYQTDTSVGSLHPMILDAPMIILSVYFIICFDVFLYHTVIDSEWMLWIMAV